MTTIYDQVVNAYNRHTPETKADINRLSKIFLAGDMESFMKTYHELRVERKWSMWEAVDIADLAAWLNVYKPQTH